MKANFNIEKNVRNSRSISALSALRKLQGLGLLLCALLMGSLQVWGADVTGLIEFGSGTGKTQINSASVTGDDSQDNTWTITTVGTTSFTSNSAYYQVGSSSKPATSITFTTTLPSSQTITSFSAKFGGFSGTAGTITLKVGDTSVGSGSLSATSDVTVTNSSNGTGTVLTVTVTGISKGVKCYYISYTYSSGPTLYTVTFDANGGSVTPASATQASAGAAIALPTPTRSGFNCTGWFTATSGGTKRGDAGGSYTPTASETIHAQWSAKTYSNYRTLCTPPSDPSITVSPASITNLDYIVGQGPSAAQNITLGGSNLTASITITAPTNFEVSTDGGSTYGDSRTVTQTGGEPDVTTVKVRLKAGLVVNTYGSANVTFESTGATTQNVAVTGHVLKPLIEADPASVSWNTQIGVTAETRSVSVTGTHLKANITATLTGGDYGSFSISTASITQTSGSASGTITITYTGSNAATTTKSTTLRLTSTDATTVDVPISFEVIEDPREQYQLLTTSNFSQFGDGAKVVLVHEGMFANHAMKNVTGSKGFDAVEEGDTEFEISGTTLYLEEGNNVQVLNVGESGAYFSLSTGSAYLQNSSDKYLTTTTTTPLPDAAKWAITVDAGDNTAAITSQGTQGQDIRYNAGQALTAQPFRCYASSTSDDIYIYFQPSANPSISVSPTSLSGFGYVVGDGANSEIKEFTVSGMNLTGNLTVKAPTNYQVSTDGGSSWSTSGGTMTISVTPPTLSSTTVKVRIVSGLSRNLDISGTVKVYGGGVLEANAKTVSVSGAVTNPFHTVTISAGANGNVSPSGAQSVEEGQTLAVTATPNTGYSFSNWTVTGSGSSCTASASGTFTMGTENATLTANFSQIMVSGITVEGNATVKTLTSTTYTATVLPAGALTKTVTWSVTNGTGTATINSSTGELTAGSPGTVTVRATATDGSGVYGELAVTIQDVVRYKFVKMTSTPSPWEDDDYLIVCESSVSAGSGTGYYLDGSDLVTIAAGKTSGSGNAISATITSNTITLEDSKDKAVHIAYVSGNGYSIKGIGSNTYLKQSGTGGESLQEPSTVAYWSNVTYDAITTGSTIYLRCYTGGPNFRAYATQSNTAIVLYRLETAYTITCNTPSNGTLTSDMGSAASGTTVTLTVTPSSGYELNTLTITKDGSGTVTPTKVDDTHYTFTMPKDNVTVEATFVTIQTKDIIFHTPSCVSTPSTLSGKATGATVTLPSEPAGTPDGYTFLGWVLAEQVSPVAEQPTTYAPGSYTVPSGAANINMYALYSEGGISVGSGTFNYIHEASSGLTTLVQLTSGDNYILSSTGNNAAVVSNTISGTRVGYGSCTGAGESTATISTADGVYLVTKTGDYYTLKNVQTGQYLASNGNASQATMMEDDGTDDHVKWSIVSTQKGYKLANKYNTDHSVNAYLGFSAGNGYGCYAASNTTITMYFYKAASGAVTINTTYTTSPDCFCEYSLLQSTNSGSTWEEVGCFTKVKPNDASDHEWQLANFTMPAHNSSTLLKVQRQGYDYGGQTGAWQSGWIPLAELQGGSCTYKAFELQGAVGTLRIYDVEGGNSVDANSNFYLGFYPTYQICHKNAAPDVWIDETFELVDAGTHKYQTAITTAPASYFADNYQFYVGARKSDGSTKFAEKNSNEATAKSNTVNMKTMGGMTSDVGGRSGVYEIYSNSCDQNWYCQFVPYYVVYYYDVNGNEIEEWRDVMTSTSTTAHPYATGQTSWNTAADGSGTTYAAGATISGLSDDLRLYQIASTYTVTYNVATETTVPAVNGTSVKVIQGQAIELPTITFSCARYPSFVGWVSGDAIVASDPEEKTEIPSTFVGAGGDSYIPTGNVTLRALYGHNCDGDAGWQKQTTISAGKYIIVAGTYGFAGLESAVTSTTNQGSYLSGVTVTDNTVASSTGMHEVDVILGANGTFAIQYSSGQYMENSSGYFNGNVTSLASAYRWKMNASGQIYDASATTMFLQINNSNHKFKCYAGTQTTYANLYKYIKTGYYTTNPTCTVPTTFTLSFDGNKPDGAAGEVSDVPSNIVRSFSPFPTLATAIDLDADITNPTLTGWKLTSWNTAANGSGTTYALDAVISEFTGNSLTLYAQWERVYTVRLFDNGVERTPLVQESAGATVTLPTGNNCTPGSAFAFEGWTESAIELNADPVRPAAATLHAAGTYTPTSDITLYSVYSSSVAGCDDFAEGVSGAYKLYNKATSDYAIVTANANRYDKASSGTAEIFYIAYSTAKSAYTIRTSLGYLGWSGASGSETLSKDNATPYYWDIKEGTSGNAGYWNFQPIGASTKQFSGNGTYFNLHSNSTKYYIRLEKTAMTYYYNTALCGGAQITFHDGGGEISGTPTTPSGASWSNPVLSGLENCDKITTFPTASYDGWTFVGWSTEDYTNCGKHTAGTSQYSDENASTDEPDASIIYKTGGNPYVVRGGSIDLYPVFTRFPENEPFNMEEGGTFYMYYLDPNSDDGYGAPQRRYAGPWDGTKRYTAVTNCANATAFTFTKSGDVWHIQNADNDKYIGGKTADDWLIENNSLGTLTDWTITIRSGNQFNATCQSGRQISVYENFFMDYASVNLSNNPNYHCVYLGSCEERIFSSEPHAVPTIDLTGEPYVTSSNGETVRATATMTLSASHLGSVPANKVIVSGGTGLKFATTASANPSNTVSLNLTDGKLAATTIYVYYTPTATEDGLENIIVTAKAYNGSSPKDLQTTGTVHCRHIPADFVIAAKWEGKWYALPNTCTFDGSSTAGVLITVDNDNDPTSATYAPSTTKWGLRKTKAGSRTDGSYNDRLVFTERATATANSQQALYNYNSAEVYTNATYTNYNNTNPERYEWIPVSSDFKDYTLTNASENKPLILRNDCEFKAQTTNQAYDGKVRLLPARFYEDNVQIVEWKTNSVIIMYTGAETTAKAKAGSNSETGAQTLSSQKLTHGIYEVTTGTALTSHTGENLILTFGSTAAGKKIFEIPWIINGSSGATSGHEKQDVVILKNGKLTAQSTKYSFRNVYVYGGGKLKIASGTQLGVNNIILRAGGISTNGSGGSATYEYVYPQVELGGTLTSTKTDIKYEYITDYDHWYHFCLPFDGNYNSITYPVEYYGDNVAADNHGSWIIKRYDGATRATGNYNAWVDIETDGDPKTVYAGHGYIYWGAPKKVTIGGDQQRQAWGIQRITMPIIAAAAMEAENANKTVSDLGSYSGVSGNSGKVNDQGWNLIGNPYMANLTGLNSTSIKTGKLVHEEGAGGQWTGRWEDNEDGIRYVTIPDDHFDSYTAQTMASFTSDNPMKTGRTFFVQIEGDATGVTFATANRASLMPALYANSEQPVDVETGIVLSDESKHDEVNFWLKDGKTEAYEYNADYPKTMNTTNFNIYGVHSQGELSWIAISPEIAEGSMAIGYQVPTGGEYTLSLSETYVSDQIEALYVTDHEVSPEVTTNLLNDLYSFYVNNAETNNTRFTVSIKLKEHDEVTTAIGNLGEGNNDRPRKFIMEDKMYILRNGVLYDATGKQVREINK